jgi:hypothetical protein
MATILEFVMAERYTFLMIWNVGRESASVEKKWRTLID